MRKTYRTGEQDYTAKVAQTLCHLFHKLCASMPRYMWTHSCFHGCQTHHFSFPNGITGIKFYPSTLRYFCNEHLWILLDIQHLKFCLMTDLHFHFLIVYVIRIYKAFQRLYTPVNKNLHTCLAMIRQCELTHTKHYKTQMLAVSTDLFSVGDYVFLHKEPTWAAQKLPSKFVGV
jgi:hypothetical protein